nr:hypothetical protein OG999_16890 [Streptomyces sp. NBC_00886]
MTYARPVRLAAPAAALTLGSAVLAAAPATAVTTHQPGAGGLPAAGGRFGYAAR